MTNKSQNEKEVLEALIFIAGLLHMAGEDPQSILNPSEDLQALVIKHYYIVLHYYGDNKEFREGKTEALKRLPDLQQAFPDLQESLVSKSLSSKLV